MTEMQDDPKHPQTELNKVPLYLARWPKTVFDGPEAKPRQTFISSGWRADLADTCALAIRMNGHIVRGYFAGML